MGRLSEMASWAYVCSLGHGACAKPYNLTFYADLRVVSRSILSLSLSYQEPKDQHQVPRVSPYRLAAHLTSAFAIYATLVWTTLDLIRPGPILSTVVDKAVHAAQSALATAARQQAAAAQVLRGRVLPLSVLVGVTAMSGKL